MNIYIPLEFPPWVFYYAIACYISMGFYIIEARSQWENKWILALLHFFAPIVIPVAIIGSILILIFVDIFMIRGR